MATVQICSEEGCGAAAAFRTRTRPAWCNEHLAETYRRAGLELLEPFTNPRAYLLTRCTSCGFEGHYRFNYVLEHVSSEPKTCRACYWTHWAKEARHYSGNIETGNGADLARVASDENEFDYLGPLTDPSLDGDPHAVRCRKCGVVSAQRVADIAWGCTCRKSNKTSTAGTSKAPGANLVKNATAEFVEWWDHEKNSERFWATAKKGSRKTAWWKCPKGHSFERRIDEMFRLKGEWCRECEENRRRLEREAYNSWVNEHLLHSVAEVEEVARAWNEPDTDPNTVWVLTEKYFSFSCERGHSNKLQPASVPFFKCKKCKGLETRKRNIAAAKSGEVKSRLSPEITSQWHPTKNSHLMLGSISPTSKRRVWWKDPLCKHEWEDVVRDRDKYQRYRCPECETILDSLAYHYPDVAAQWSDENELSPWQIRPNTSKLSPPPLWVCPTDPTHTWRAMPAQRINGSGCPECKTVGKSAVERLYAQAAKKVWGNSASGKRVFSDQFTNHSSWSVDVLVDLPDGRTLGIEYDGSYWHKNKTELDTVKSHDLLRYGLVLCRIREHPLQSLDIGDPNYVELVAYAGSNDPQAELEGLKQRLEATS